MMVCFWRRWGVRIVMLVGLLVVVWMIAAEMGRMSCLMEDKIANYNIVCHYTLCS